MKYLKCDKDTWTKAQNHEFDVWGGYNVEDGDDWSSYWADNFDNYTFLKDLHFDDVIEVGCGPYGMNIRTIIKLITYQNLYVLDPLLDKYCENKKSGIHNFIASTGANGFSDPLEEFAKPNAFDLIICNNVLDHCYDAPKCFDNMINSLKSGGILIFGNDLKQDEEVEHARDHMHPILLQKEYLDNIFLPFEKVYYKIEEREHVRNPDACSGAYFGAFKKQ